MAKLSKDFTKEALTGAEKFISDAKKRKAESRNPDVYRINLILSVEMGEFIEELHWRERLSRQQVVASILEAYKEAWEAQEAKKKE